MGIEFSYKERTFSFGKFDYYNHGRKVNEAEIEIRLDKDENRFRVSLSGGLWNGRKTDYIYCGQCVDDLGEDFPSLKENIVYNTLFDIWKNCHLKFTDSIDKKYVDKINLLLDDSKSNKDLEKLLA